MFSKSETDDVRSQRPVCTAALSAMSLPADVTAVVSQCDGEDVRAGGLEPVASRYDGGATRRAALD